MNRELQKYYEDRFSMMATQGWKDLMEDLDKMLAATNNLNGVDDEKQLWFKKGELSILYWLMNLKDASTEVYESLQAEETENAQTLV